MPLWDARQAAGGKLPEPALVSGEGIHMPNPSYWPLLTAVGVFWVLASLMTIRHVPHWYLITISGALWLFFSAFKWAFEPPG